MTDLRAVVFVPGAPQPQGSMRAFVTADGKALITTSNKSLGEWRLLIAAEAIRQLGGRPLLAGPVGIELTFVLPRPRSLPKRVLLPAKRPDLDKLVRGTLDALTAVAYRDDAQVCSISARKRYTVGSEQPGVFIRVFPKEEEQP